MRNNKGYSLVEIMVVIAVIGVVTSTTIVGTKMAKSANVSNSANVINSYMASIRLNNMSKVNMQYLHLYRYKDSDYYSIDNTKNVNTSKWNLENQLGNADSTVFYRTTGGEKALKNGDILTISYTRAGECKIYTGSGGTASSYDLKSLTFANTRKSVTIRVLPAIGKCYIE